VREEGGVRSRGAVGAVAASAGAEPCRAPPAGPEHRRARGGGRGERASAPESLELKAPPTG